VAETTAVNVATEVVVEIQLTPLNSAVRVNGVGIRTSLISASIIRDDRGTGNFQGMWRLGSSLVQ
jgi:hypothetical protein